MDLGKQNKTKLIQLCDAYSRLTLNPKARVVESERMGEKYPLQIVTKSKWDRYINILDKINLRKNKR